MRRLSIGWITQRMRRAAGGGLINNACYTSNYQFGADRAGGPGTDVLPECYLG